ncbi:hypothetical protein HZI73_20540 [Vallitalea pronyensis]|uniref:Uncharacterized protein n=1 Tax=Vallitalea pronyensis TaxID=1348613 RepID=A0A8J8MNN0_9FIRM|nr:hypothetical protein [Vallitalea pronyensis]QUI24543.1 hypothetical protein HZI73_20540 [Vallitalea pronyensis]
MRNGVDNVQYSKKIIALMMERQYLSKSVSINDYDQLYKDTSPGQNVYWSGFGEPPTLSFRTSFNDIDYNRQRQLQRKLLKGRFQGNNLGWIDRDDLELFASLFKKSINNLNAKQQMLLELIEREGPLTIQLMKEMTGLLVKEITPVLHQLQKAFLIYEDQYDNEWDRGWYIFGQMFPNANIEKYSMLEALKIVLQRFAYRIVLFDEEMVKSFYKLPKKIIRSAIQELVQEEVLMPYDDQYMLKTDEVVVNNTDFYMEESIYVLHRNDFLVKANEHWLKEHFKSEQFKTLQYILVNGEFKGAVMGQFKYGPYIIEDVILELDDDEWHYYKEGILQAVHQVNDPIKSPIKKINGIKCYER